LSNVRSLDAERLRMGLVQPTFAVEEQCYARWIKKSPLIERASNYFLGGE
jgi:hypothetical protein